MKKILFLLMLLLPISVNAEIKVEKHLINAEIEIAGGLNVKEIIVTSGTGESFKRTINYKNIDKKWDRKTINFDDMSMYNGYSLENVKIAVYEFNESVDFDAFGDEIEGYLNELDPKNIKDEYFTKVDNNLGLNLNIKYDTSNNNKTIYYLEYLVSNVIVVHEDIAELNYSFKNLNYETDTSIRVILPYSTDSELYNTWLRGPSSGEFNYLVNNNNENLGILATFPSLKTEVTVRMTIPKEHVGIDIYLNKTETKALDEIIKLEDSKVDKVKYSELGLKIIKYGIIIASCLYVPFSLFFYKFYNKNLITLYLFLGVILIMFNIIFKYQIIYLYFIILAPLIIILLKNMENKRK